MLTVIIVTWNVRELLAACLHSLQADLAEVPARIVVVDNASADGTVAMLRRDFPAVELIVCESNAGYAKANNLALRVHLADSEYFWLLNPDTVVHRGAVAALLAFMRVHPRCGLCGPMLLNADGSLQHGAFALPGLVQLLLETQPLLWRFRDTWLDGRYPVQRYVEGRPFRVGHPLGAAMFARAEAVRQVGLLDEAFEMYAEEVDWAVRMAQAGWECWCVPTARVTHYGGASSRQANERAEQLKWRSRQRFYAKHYPPWKRWLAQRLVPPRYRDHAASGV